MNIDKTTTCRIFISIVFFLRKCNYQVTYGCVQRMLSRELLITVSLGIDGKTELN